MHCRHLPAHTCSRMPGSCSASRHALSHACRCLRRACSASCLMRSSPRTSREAPLLSGRFWRCVPSSAVHLAPSLCTRVHIDSRSWEAHGKAAHSRGLRMHGCERQGDPPLAAGAGQPEQRRAGRLVCERAVGEWGVMPGMACAAGLPCLRRTWLRLVHRCQQCQPKHQPKGHRGRGVLAGRLHLELPTPPGSWSGARIGPRQLGGSPSQQVCLQPRADCELPHGWL